MEFLNGGNLKGLLTTLVPLDLKTLRLLTAEILSGLEFLHSRNIIHRDLKTENILLDSVGHVRIADFGLSVMYGSDKLTQIAGTPGYMAPEVLTSMPYNTMADYYFLGVILYALAVGKHPFMTDNDFYNAVRLMFTTESYYPGNMDIALKDLLYRLLQVQQEIQSHLLRDIRGHQFFETINWAKIEEGTSLPRFSLAPIPEKPSYGTIEVTEFILPEDLENLSQKSRRCSVTLPTSAPMDWTGDAPKDGQPYERNLHYEVIPTL